MIGWFPHTLLLLLTFNFVVFISRGLLERYRLSDLREEESSKISSYYLLIGLPFLVMFSFLLLVSFLTMIEVPVGNVLLFINLSMNAVFFGSLFLFAYISSKYPHRDIKRIKKLKLADELFLDRAEGSKFYLLFLNPYQLHAKMIKDRGVESAAWIQMWIGVGVIISYFAVVYIVFLSGLFFCLFFSIVSIFLIVAIYLSYKKRIEHFREAQMLARSWIPEDVDKGDIP